MSKLKYIKLFENFEQPQNLLNVWLDINKYYKQNINSPVDAYKLVQLGETEKKWKPGPDYERLSQQRDVYEDQWKKENGFEYKKSIILEICHNDIDMYYIQLEDNQNGKLFIRKPEDADYGFAEYVGKWTIGKRYKQLADYLEQNGMKADDETIGQIMLDWFNTVVTKLYDVRLSAGWCKNYEPPFEYTISDNDEIYPDGWQATDIKANEVYFVDFFNIDGLPIILSRSTNSSGDIRTSNDFNEGFIKKYFGKDLGDHELIKKQERRH